MQKDSLRENAGFGVVGIVVVVLAVLAAGFIAWRVFDANSSQSSQGVSNNQAQTVDAPQSQHAGQADPNAGHVVIKEWGVRFKPVEGLGGVQYFKPSSIETDSFTLTTDTLAQAAASCSAASGDILLGLITRSTESQPVNGSVLAKIGDYYYQYRGPQATCGAGGDLESNVVPNLSQSLSTLEAAE